jgi:hypothetical protein
MLRALIASRILHLVLASGPLALALAPEAALPLAPGIVPGGDRVIDTLADIPPEWRRLNWLGPRGKGSCVHAAMAHLLHWQGRHELAAWWSANHGDGETFPGLMIKLDRAGVRWAGTSDGDEDFLTWAIRTRRGAAVVVANGRHMVNLVGLDSRSAFILDSNSPEKIQTWDRQKFLAEWQRSGGWAVTPVYLPPPPKPHLVSSQSAVGSCYH